MHQQSNFQILVETMFEFLFTQMSYAKTQSCNEFDSCMFFTIKSTVEGWLDKFSGYCF